MRRNFNVISSNKIENLNHALFVLKHFVGLSARILPILHGILSKKSPSENELEDAKKIMMVYNNYTFDNDTSKQLINSDILDNIRNCFEALTENRKDAKQELNLFLDEYKSLTQDWKYIESN